MARKKHQTQGKWGLKHPIWAVSSVPDHVSPAQSHLIAAEHLCSPLQAKHSFRMLGLSAEMLWIRPHSPLDPERVPPCPGSQTQAPRRCRKGFPPAGKSKCWVQRNLLAAKPLCWRPVLSEAALLMGWEREGPGLVPAASQVSVCLVKHI